MKGCGERRDGVGTESLAEGVFQSPIPEWLTSWLQPRDRHTKEEPERAL